MRSTRFRRRRRRRREKRNTQMLVWRVKLSMAAGWTHLLDHEMPFERWRLLGEFWNDDDVLLLAHEQITRTARQCNWLAKAYGPIPEHHWNAALQWRKEIAPFAEIARQG